MHGIHYEPAGQGLRHKVVRHCIDAKSRRSMSRERAGRQLSLANHGTRTPQSERGLNPHLDVHFRYTNVCGGLMFKDRRGWSLTGSALCLRPFRLVFESNRTNIESVHTNK